MEYIKGFTFGWGAKRGDFSKAEAKESLKLLKERTASEYVIFALAATQETAFSTEVIYDGEHMVTDHELEEMIDYARSLDLKIMIKPTVNPADGIWRAHINFFDIDVPCEPKWRDWFRSYTDYQLHYAKIAAKKNAEMFIVGCEMVQTERKEQEWRQLIREVRQAYKGLITYNTDKYQEANVSWWDEVDVISSSGYYPLGDWDNQLDRIEEIIKPFNKPFFFAEAGCPSRTGSANVPNDWSMDGEINFEEQRAFYQDMFAKTAKRDWVLGFGLWDWKALLYPESEADKDGDYAVYGKPAENVIKNFYLSN
ncbi:glycoside hydrolase family 113 [Gracilibacillus salinarum]|uniref:1,4-beta-xylanase n=1 Tax=Gracilibacillus salinarum TaxID=2932255 RepID=A0ABY4GLJ3_9BACI|nr:1,4-beta-xylanase [Gracilibacillus salinarum]UOQ85041.1 1,4-beta-xylanase [Gracilibacillus salinarum]